MKYREVRNLITAGLGSFLGLPVVLGNQVDPEMEYPFVIYSSTAPYIPEATLGEYSETEDDGSVWERRQEQPLCTMSFTVCSMNRGEYPDSILGDDEALELAEKAQGWFLHTGYDYISGKGITVVNVANVQERSFLQADEEARRYGFDVELRYVRIDERELGTVEAAATVRKGEENE